MTSVYFVVSAVVWFNIAMLAVALLCRKTVFLAKYSTTALLLCAALSIIRIALPLDLPFAYVIRSYDIIPAMRRALETDIMPGDEYIKVSTAILLIWAAGMVTVLARTVLQLSRERKLRREYTTVKSEQLSRVFSTWG